MNLSAKHKSQRWRQKGGMSGISLCVNGENILQRLLKLGKEVVCPYFCCSISRKNVSTRGRKGDPSYMISVAPNMRV